ncbi:MAG TPA: sigma-70 family RNA polymerase sigma factor, partial [Bacteroidia bacterium]|nr:sigma-70 family RNA polymerase sigma factor [Bacteroidia bacterium]
IQEQYNRLFLSFIHKVNPDKRDDLRQELNLCLLRAIKKYDLKRKPRVLFITYLYKHLRHGLKEVYSQTLIPIEISKQYKLPAFTYVQLIDIPTKQPEIPFVAMVAGLSELQKQILTYKYCNDLTFTEIAAIMNINRNVIYSQLNTALCQLRGQDGNK